MDNRQQPPERLTLLLAYIDGELPPEDAQRLEASLSENERHFIAAERALKFNVAAVVGDADVPDQTMQKILARIRQPTIDRTKVRFFTTRRIVASVAAVLLLALAVAWFGRPARDDTAIVLQESLKGTVSDLKRESTVPAKIEEIDKFLKEHGIQVNLAGVQNLKINPHAIGHETYLLGARSLIVGGEDCVAILFNCCDSPVKIVLSRKGSKIGDVLERTAKTSAQSLIIQTQDMTGGRATFIGTHDAHALLELFS